MSGKSCFTLAAIVLTALFSNGQSSNDLSARYAAASAYQVRPGILMTAKVCGRWTSLRNGVAACLHAGPNRCDSMSEMGYYDSTLIKPQEAAALGWENC
jgi:hypothetical protein